MLPRCLGTDADRTAGRLWLAPSAISPPAPNQLLGSATADGSARAERRAAAADAAAASITTSGPTIPQTRGGASAAANRMVGGVRLALLGNAAGARAGAWSAGGRWRIMGYSGRADAAHAARGLYPRVRARPDRRRAVAPAQPPTGWSVACGSRSLGIAPLCVRAMTTIGKLGLDC
jgi:hypothetical protein